MTLKNRNRCFTLFGLSSVVFVLIFISIFVIEFIKNGIIRPPAELRVFSFLDNFALSKYNFISIICSIFVLSIYVPLAVFFIVRFFGKTQSTEIIFFILFLTGVLFESLRFYMISKGLWITFSDKLISIGKLILFGRTLVSLSFLFAALMSQSNQRQGIVRNLFIITAFSIIISILTPLNTSRILSTGMIEIGFSRMYSIFKLLIVLVTIVAFNNNAHRQDKVGFTWISVSFFSIITGYTILIHSDCFLLLSLGIVFLIFGTLKYLVTIHEIYLWK